MTTGLYGIVRTELSELSHDKTQFSPLIPGASSLEDLADSALESFAVLAPAGVLERRYVLAHALRVVQPGGNVLAVAAKDRGGLRLAGELSAFGCTVGETARRHHRICRVKRPDAPNALQNAIAAGGRQIPPGLGLWSQPGVFSWDRIDDGAALLMRDLPEFAGHGADFGCGVGVLARAVLAGGSVSRLALVDIDRRAIDASRQNVPDPRAAFLWRDVRIAGAGLRDLDFIVMNPPFHDGGAEDRGLGQAFIRSAAAALKPNGACWLVANQHLPYEVSLKASFRVIRLVRQVDGYKVYEARR